MSEIEKGSANVYEDLGLPDAAEMQVKATLAAKIGEIIKHRHLTQTEAAEILGMPQPKLSGMLLGQFRGISEAKMLECMNRLGRDVQVAVRKTSRSRTTGRTSVVFACKVTDAKSVLIENFILKACNNHQRP
jgi:predicted XRE-type DNA-binding protein